MESNELFHGPDVTPGERLPGQLDGVLPHRDRASEVENVLRRHLQAHAEVDPGYEEALVLLQNTVNELLDRVAALEERAARQPSGWLGTWKDRMGK
jgi:hypothetical protein